MQYSTDNVGFTFKTYGGTLHCIDFLTISINFIRICGDSKIMTCNAYLFSCNIYMCIQSENYGDLRQCAISITITCTLQGTPCNTGIPHTFYWENICSVETHAGFFQITPISLSFCQQARIFFTVASKQKFHSFGNSCKCC